MTSRRPLTRNPERTRRRLLAAAIKLFSRDGYHAVAVDDIVAAAKANKRMVYHYFGSKDDIYQAAFHEVYQRIESVEFGAVESTGTPRFQLARLLEAYFDFLDNNPEFVRLLLWENLEKGRHIASRLHPLDKNPFLVRFREIVEIGMARGEFRPDLNVTHLLIHFIGLCFIYHSNRFSLSQSLHIDLGDPGEKVEGRKQVLALVLAGIQARAGAPPAKQRLHRPE
jgi:TetR/AcrR family transcriptional regulator